MISSQPPFEKHLLESLSDDDDDNDYQSGSRRSDGYIHNFLLVWSWGPLSEDLAIEPQSQIERILDVWDMMFILHGVGQYDDAISKLHEWKELYDQLPEVDRPQASTSLNERTKVSMVEGALSEIGLAIFQGHVKYDEDLKTEYLEASFLFAYFCNDAAFMPIALKEVVNYRHAIRNMNKVKKGRDRRGYPVYGYESGVHTSLVYSSITEYLLEYANTSPTTDLVLAAAAVSPVAASFGLLLDRTGGRVSGELLELAASNTHGTSILRTILERGGDDVRITEATLCMAASNKECGEDVMRLLLECWPKETPVPEAVLKAAERNRNLQMGRRILLLLNPQQFPEEKEENEENRRSRRLARRRSRRGSNSDGSLPRHDRRLTTFTSDYT